MSENQLQGGSSASARREEEDPDISPIAEGTLSFIGRINGLAISFPLVTSLLEDGCKTEVGRFHEFIKETAEEVKEESESSEKPKRKYKLGISNIHVFWKWINDLLNVDSARIIIPQSFVLSLVSQYDFFLGHLLRCLYLMRPELLNASEKSLTYGQLLDFESMDEAKEFVLEKEIEWILRKSHVDQFLAMEKIFSIELRKGLDAWPMFVEVTERRNLFAHTNGVVSRQYLEVCQKHNVAVGPETRVGKTLGASEEYFDAAYGCIFEIGVKLAKVLWRKTCPKEIALADELLTQIIYDLLVRERYDLARKLADFSQLTVKTFSSDARRRVFIVNRAQAYKWNGDESLCRQILEQEDWSSCSDKFKLARFVLLEDFEQAAKLMIAMGKSGEINEEAYQAWPLFKEFRKSESFLSAYEDIFGRPFVTVEEPQIGGVNMCEASEE